MRRSMLALLLLAAVTNGTGPVFGSETKPVCCVCMEDFLPPAVEGIAPSTEPRPAISCREVAPDQAEPFVSSCQKVGGVAQCLKELKAIEGLVDGQSEQSCVERIAEFGFLCPASSGAPAMSGTGIALLLAGLTALGMATVRHRSRRRV
jgi:hypothetical protein